MRFEQLRYVDAIVRTQSFRRAAELLGVSQATVSQQIHLLELELKTQLLLRSRSGVVPTVEGQRLLAHVRSILSAEEALRQEAGLISGLQVGKIHLGTIALAVHSVVVNAVRDVRINYPGITVQLTETNSGDLERLLLGGRVDIGVAMVPKTTSEAGAISAIQYDTLLHSPLVVCLPVDHPLARRDSIDRNDLFGVPLILYPQGFGALPVIRSVLGELPKDPAIVVSSTFTALLLVEAGLGIAITSALAIAAQGANDRIAFRPFKEPADFELGVMRRQGERLSSAASVMVDALHATARQVSARGCVPARGV